MKKTLTAVALSLSVLAVGAVQAQVGKAASEATDSVRHKIDEKRADKKAKESGPVGKAVNEVKSTYHEKQSERSAQKAKEALKK